LIFGWVLVRDKTRAAAAQVFRGAVSLKKKKIVILKNYTVEK
jgi:hypothetical protein